MSNSSGSTGSFFNTLKKSASNALGAVTGAVNLAGQAISGNSSALPTKSNNSSTTVGMMGGKRKSRNNHKRKEKKSKKTRKNMKRSRKHSRK
jgi:hypothetical protein